MEHDLFPKTGFHFFPDHVLADEEDAMVTATPFLMFEGKAEEAMTFYTSLIPDSRIISMEKYGPQGPGPRGP